MIFSASASEPQAVRPWVVVREGASTNQTFSKRVVAPAATLSKHDHIDTDAVPGAVRRLTALGSQEITASSGYLLGRF